MDKRITAFLVCGLILVLLLSLLNVFLAGIALIVLAAVFMSLVIMQDTQLTPLLAVALSEDARNLVITNTGNAPAHNIHVTLVPMDTEFDLSALGTEVSHTYRFPSMVGEVKVVVTYENEQGGRYSLSRKLSATDAQDPFRPVIPLFGYR